MVTLTNCIIIPLAVPQSLTKPLGKMDLGKNGYIEGSTRGELLNWMGDLDIPDHDGTVHFMEVRELGLTRGLTRTRVNPRGVSPLSTSNLQSDVPGSLKPPSRARIKRD